MRWKQELQKPEKAIRLSFWLFDLMCLAAALAVPDRGQMFEGLGRICTSSAQFTKSFFDSTYGGLSGTFLNAALVGVICTLAYYLPGSKANALSLLAFFLTVGFGFWGLTVLNIWFGVPGVLLYCLIKKQKPGQQANAMLFTTGLAPLFTELIFRYPYIPWHGFGLKGFLLALAVGTFLGLTLPAGLAASPKVHRGFTLYSAALPMGLTAFVLRTGLYQVTGANLPETSGVGLASSFWGTANVLCLAMCVVAIGFGLAMGGTPKGYLQLMKDSGHGVDYTVKYGVGNTALNFGVYGLMILAYYNLIGANWNAVTLGCVFSMVGCCAAGSHPRNVWPIMVGYLLVGVAAKQVFLGMSSFPVSESWYTVNAQALVVGLCFASALCPIPGKYGWWWGVVAGALHCALVTCIPLFHGGFLLYNGGFTAALVCMFLVPVLEHFFTERNGSKKPAKV